MKHQTIKLTAAVAAVGIAGSIATPVLAADAASKEENVYVTLSQSGTVEDVYVVNLFDLQQDSTVKDYGNYSSVKNLSNQEQIQQNQDEIEVKAEKGSFYYQGNLENCEIPWNIQLVYELDGKELAPQDIAGKSGHLKIHGSITQNTQAKGSFFDDFMIQAVFTLDTVKCRNIRAEGATAANVGANKQLTYMKVPKEDLHFEIEADVTDFSMEGASFNAVPLALKIEKPDTKELDDQIAKLQDGAKELDDGAKQLRDGTNTLKDGGTKLQSGTQALVSGANELATGAGKLQSGADQLAQGTGELFGGLNTLAGQSSALQNGAGQIFDSLLGAANTQMQPVLQAVGIEFTPLTKQNYSAVLEQIKNQIGGVALQQATEQARKTVTEQVTQAVKTQVEQQVTEAVKQAVTQQVNSQQEQIRQAVTQTVQQQVEQSVTEEQILALAYQIISADPAYAQADEQTKQAAAAVLAQQKHDELKQQIVQTAMASAEIVQKIETLVQQQIEQQIETAMQSEQVKQQIADQTQQQMNSEQVQGLIAMQIETTMASEQVQKQIADAVAQATGEDSAVIKQINGLATQLMGFDTFYQGLLQYTNGVNTAATGAAALKDGASGLQSGISQLGGGVQSLQQGANALQDGATQLVNGVGDLQDGTQKMADGTGELHEKTADMDSKMQEEIDRLLNQFSGEDTEIQSFVSDKNENVESVQFVMSTDPIEVPEEQPQEQPQPQKQSLWERFLDLFRK